MTKKTAFLFPGQGSQALGMGKELAEKYPAAKKIFQEADQILGFSLTKIMWEGEDDQLHDTVNTQPALFVHSFAAWKVLSELAPDLQPATVAGHSLGEISALAAANALSFEDGLRLVRRRGELMKRAGEIAPGGMAAILGMDISALDEICAQASQKDEIVQVANDNCPGQVVISGEENALKRAMNAAKEAGARRVIPLAVSIAAHSPLMVVIQTEFAQALADADIREASLPLVSNVTAFPIHTVDALRDDLCAQLTSRVRWRESIQNMLEDGVERFVELGSGNVLNGLLKRIDRSKEGLVFDSANDFESSFDDFLQ